MPALDVFVTGATGYMGSRLAAELAARGHRVRALVREGSRSRLPPGCAPVIGDALDAATLAATILRPWYALGPAHRWPYLLAPAYRILELIPRTRPSALRLGLVTIDDMVAALVEAVERSADAVRIVEVPEIRGARSRLRDPPLR
jgi:uncharacterized protein YbjT (DUF2867 family)